MAGSRDAARRSPEGIARRAEQSREWGKRKYAKKKAWLCEKKARPCAKCGEQHPCPVMEFHHRNPAEKCFGISSGQLNRRTEVLEAEMEKCDLLCANCHRLVEAGL